MMENPHARHFRERHLYVIYTSFSF